MKKFLGILVLGLLWCNVGFSGNISDLAWIKDQKKFSTTNDLIWEDKFKQLLKSNISTKLLYLGMSENMKKISLLKHFQEVLGGPPDEIQYYDNNRYIVATACRQHSCPEKGLLWIDTEKKILVGLILHYFFEDSKYNEKGDFLIFSNNFKNFNEVPKAFISAVQKWIDKIEFAGPNKTRFLGSSNLITQISFNSDAEDIERKILINFDGICVQNIDRINVIIETAENENWREIPPGEDAMIAPRVKGPSYKAYGFKDEDDTYLVGVNDAENTNACSLAAKYNDLDNFRKIFSEFYKTKLVNESSQGMQTTEFYVTKLIQSSQESFIVLTFSGETNYKFISITVLVPNA
jgi:hypothetical protein